MADCAACGEKGIGVLVRFGPQPPSNRFLPVGGHDSDLHPLTVGQCAACGLIQLIDPMPAAMVKSRFDWLTYREPEGHLDALVERLVRLPGITPASVVHGLTYKDESTLARFVRHGFTTTAQYEPAGDLGIDDPLASLETIQAAVTPQAVARIRSRHGEPDMLIVRHVVEHAHDPMQFLAGLRSIAKPGGYVILEMPDCTKFVDACDYTFVWEEHILYFCAETFGPMARRAGFEVVDLPAYEYAFEDSLIAILRAPAGAQPPGATPVPAPASGRVLDSGRRFGESYEAARARVRARLEAERARGGRIGVFGAGHLAVKFINLLGVADLVECVVDDHPRKQGMRMPGSGLPVVGSGVLRDGGVTLCLLATSPESERAILAKQQEYTQGGGRFASIFRTSPTALLPVGEP